MNKKDLLKQDIIPVISPLGMDGNGQTFRVNSDGVALEVSEALNAAKLMFITKIFTIKIPKMAKPRNTSSV